MSARLSVLYNWCAHCRRETLLQFVRHVTPRKDEAEDSWKEEMNWRQCSQIVKGKRVCWSHDNKLDIDCIKGINYKKKEEYMYYETIQLLMSSGTMNCVKRKLSNHLWANCAKWNNKYTSRIKRCLPWHELRPQH